jgi:hypothetical protein
MGKQGRTSAECACSKMCGLCKTDIGVAGFDYIRESGRAAGPPVRRTAPVCTFTRLDDEIPCSIFNVRNQSSTAKPVAAVRARQGGSEP